MRTTVGAAVNAASHLRQSRVYKAPKRILRKIGRLHFARLVASLHPGCHQGPNKTALDRYPEIFAAAAAAAPNARRILSFGCSTGEECVTLANYFPNAQIVGTDINPVNLLKARRTNPFCLCQRPHPERIWRIRRGLLHDGTPHLET
jgi:hypothetical protein